MVIPIVRLPAILSARGDRSKSAHYKDIKDGLFTPPVKTGLRASGWPENELAAINAARIAGQSDAEIIKLVAQLIADRKNAPIRAARNVEKAGENTHTPIVQPEADSKALA